ncbi:Glycerol-1-phosphate phosphohydrolase 2 [Escovopsis weberi]|uniref:Glycerol-1-phosphate phosphohydrolase 2 n=1 Tax=Escovopsis weberi TaxID=150374 RepID=A0A0M9VTN0_ESCWE|nr:Glycerol-1-phosphate phosphohydrolase 2 [Escovopsis weberi]
MGSLPDYSLPPQQVTLSGFLFDMDGTLIDSTPAVIKHWTTIGNELGVDPQVILQTSHGRRSIDVLQIIAPERANWESAVEIPGARALLDALNPAPKGGSGSESAASPWAIVTSGTRPLVEGWLRRLALLYPPHLITAESVAVGKPHPAGYLLGLAALGLQDSAGEVLVVEDSPAGIRAGKAAGCRVLGLVTSHTADEVLRAEPDWVVRDLESVRVVAREGGRVTLEIANGLRG